MHVYYSIYVHYSCRPRLPHWGYCDRMSANGICQ
jgi:hypothetical protein